VQGGKGPENGFMLKLRVAGNFFPSHFHIFTNIIPHPLFFYFSSLHLPYL
jgi:hypothetical protein